MAAVGGKVGGLLSIANNGLFAIQPASGQEYTVHNIYYAGSVQINQTDGVNVLNYMSDSSAGGMLGYNLNVTNTLYITIKNMSGSAMLIGYDGVQTT